MSHFGCFFPHFKILEGFTIHSFFVEKSKPVNGLGIFLPPGCFIKFNSFIEIFVNNFALLIKDASDPFNIVKLLQQFLSNEPIGTHRNGFQ